jgi:hypothetical protein
LDKPISDLITHLTTQANSFVNNLTLDPKYDLIVTDPATYSMFLKICRGKYLQKLPRMLDSKIKDWNTYTKDVLDMLSKDDAKRIAFADVFFNKYCNAPRN